MMVAKPALSRRELIPIGIILSLVVLAWTLDSLLNPMIKSTDLNIMATIVSKDMDPTLYPRDNLFAGDELYRLYTPLYRSLIAQAWRLGGSFEIGLAWLVPPVLSIYLVGMFILFWRVTQHSWIALILTVACAYYHPLTMGAEVWGVGGSAEMMSRTVFLPALPFITLFVLRMLEQPAWHQAALAGLVLGLASNLNPVSGFHLLALFAMWLIIVHRRSWPGWQALLVMSLAALIGALPVSWNFVRNSGQVVDNSVTFATFSQIVTERYSIPFFPQTFRWAAINLELTRPMLDIMVWLYPVLALLFLLGCWWGGRYRPGVARWSWLLGGLVTLAYTYMIVLFNTTLIFAIVGLHIVYCFWRGQWSRLDSWLMILMGLAVAYAFVGYYVLALVWQRFEAWALTSLLVEYARAARFVYLPVYLLAGAALATWVNELREHLKVPAACKTAGFSGGVMSVVIILLVLTLFGPLALLAADYLPLPARNLFDPASRVAGPVSYPADAELYAWIRQNTSRDALFYGCFGPETMTYFRHKAQRSITHNWKDMTFAVHQRAALVSVYTRFRELDAACKSFDSVVAAAHTIGADYLLVSRQDAAVFAHEACFVNEKYAVFSLRPPGCAGQ